MFHQLLWSRHLSEIRADIGNPIDSPGMDPHHSLRRPSQWRDADEIPIRRNVANFPVDMDSIRGEDCGSPFHFLQAQLDFVVLDPTWIFGN